VADVTEQAVLEELERMLVDVIGDDLLLDGPLTMETSFDQDLQLESIEFVALSERLLETYGEQVDFVSWLAEMELDEIIALTVGQVVAFVAANAQPTSGADA
jgi:acyl carrier protein